MKDDDYRGWDDPEDEPMIRSKHKLPIASNQKIKPRYPPNKKPKKRKIYKILVSQKF